MHNGFGSGGDAVPRSAGERRLFAAPSSSRAAVAQTVEETYDFPMRMIKTLPVVTLLAALAFSLASCTGDASEIDPTPEASADQPVGSDESDGAMFGQQQAALSSTNPKAAIIAQATGSGSITVDVASLPDEHTQLGAAVLCTGSGDWELQLTNHGSSSATGGCTTQGASSMSAPVGARPTEQRIEITAEKDSKIWVTVFVDE
ncbi:hypothetical protein CQ017_15605 [Arthrobacter sp. MYb224]|nr:hypothetical protein CQ017_15605 [Arthrobacter sp. MYb224]